MLVRIVDSEQRSGESGDLAETDEERFVDLPLRLDEDPAVKHDHSSNREYGCCDELYVGVVFHVSILFVSPACYAGLGGFVNCPRIACGFGFHRPVCGMPSRFSQFRRQKYTFFLTYARKSPTSSKIAGDFLKLALKGVAE